MFWALPSGPKRMSTAWPRRKTTGGGRARGRWGRTLACESTGSAAPFRRYFAKQVQRIAPEMDARPRRQWTRIAKALPTRAGRLHKVKDTMRVSVAGRNNTETQTHRKTHGDAEGLQGCHMLLLMGLEECTVKTKANKQQAITTPTTYTNETQNKANLKCVGRRRRNEVKSEEKTT